MRLVGVDAQAADVDRLLVVVLGLGHPGAPQRGLHARAELAHRERLGDVVVGPELEPEHLVDLLRLGGEHDDRDGRALRAQALADLEPVHARQHQVEHHEVELLLVEARERLAAVGGLHDLVAVALQREGEQRLDRLLVVDQQDAWGAIGHDRSGVEDSARYPRAVLDVRVYRAAFLPGARRAVRRGLLARRPSGTRHDAARGRRVRRRARLRRPRAAAQLARRAGRARSRTGSPARPTTRRSPTAWPSTLGRPEPDQGPAFRVTRERDGDVETVIGVRPGLSSRRIVVLSHRDAVERPGPGRAVGHRGAARAGARVPRARAAQDARARLHLAAPRTGSRARARGPTSAPTAAVEARASCSATWRPRASAKPWVVPWSLGPGAAPLGAPAHGRERRCAPRPGRPGGSRATAQWIRRALPFTVSEQGVIADAVAAGRDARRVRRARPAARRAPCGASGSSEFGRAALRAVIAIDAAGPAQDDRAAAAPAFADGPQGIVTMRNVLPDWAVRLLVGTLLLPAFLTALDGFFRVRRRHLAGRAVAGLAAARPALPVLLAWLWARALGLTGALEPPDGAGAAAAAARARRRAWRSARSRFVLAARLVRHAAAAARARRRAREPGRGQPRRGLRRRAVHAGRGRVGRRTRTPPRCCCPPPTCGCSRPRRRRASSAGAGVGGDRRSGCCRSRFAALYYMRALALDPLELAWMTLLSAASGQLSVGGRRSWRRRCSPAWPALIAVMRTRRRVAANAEPEPLRTRGPASYAGPGLARRHGVRPAAMTATAPRRPASAARCARCRA